MREKLGDPTAQLVLVERDDAVVGMALAEAFREGDGTRAVRAGWGHVSMVFVHPRHQGAGLGAEVVRSLIAGARWKHLSLWTRESNARAQRLYRRTGFLPTGELGWVAGEQTRRWERTDPGKVGPS